MKLTDAISRAHFAAAQPCTYKLGAGGWPHESLAVCDCSGFAPSWLFQRPREVGGVWFNTDMIWHAAVKGMHGFRQIPHQVPGCLLVYPSDAKHAHGHIAFATTDTLIVDCSASNPPGRAIQERLPIVFAKNLKTIFVWWEGLEK